MVPDQFTRKLLWGAESNKLDKTHVVSISIHSKNALDLKNILFELKPYKVNLPSSIKSILLIRRIKNSDLSNRKTINTNWLKITFNLENKKVNLNRFIIWRIKFLHRNILKSLLSQFWIILPIVNTSIA